MMRKILFLIQAVLVSVVAKAQSDVDTRIAVNDQKDPNTFVIIMANENYKYEQTVPYALNDGETFKLYCEKTLGVPQKNIRYTPDATLNDMRMQLQWLSKVMQAYGGEARAIVYYSGHGMPSEDGQNAYLLPVDGNSRLSGSGLSTKTLYKQLGEMPATGIIVLLDACFSGARRDGQMLASSRGVALKTREDAVEGKMVVFSAAQGDETAYPYAENQHGLFTYYLLEQLQENGGQVTLGDLSDNVTKQVGRVSIVENDKSQTPKVVASASAADWRNWKMSRQRASRYETVERTTPVAAATQAASQSTAAAQPVAAQPASQPEPAVESAAPQVSQGRVFTVGNVSFTMIPVKGTTFTMGAPNEQGKEAESDERPTHLVTLSDYYIGETEVTQELWEAVMHSNPSKFQGANHPVEQVSWIDCQNFIEELNVKTGQHFRLPTEAEWEYAAHGGDDDWGSRFPGMGAVHESAWFSGNAGGSTHSVKSKKPNALGLYDMIGNVWEWCSDLYDKKYYSESPLRNPKGPSSGTLRVRRGGAWYCDGGVWRVCNRDNSEPNSRFDSLGLRLAM